MFINEPDMNWPTLGQSQLRSPMHLNGQTVLK